MSYSVPIIIEETSGIDRHDEPVTLGVPFPRGRLKNLDQLCLKDPVVGHTALQSETLAKWPDGSLKWVLLDFQVSAGADSTKEMELTFNKSWNSSKSQVLISTKEDQDQIIVDTTAAVFHLDTKTFKLFDSVVIDSEQIVDSKNSKIVLTDEDDVEYLPAIKNIFFEIKGELRTNLRIEGEFKSSNSLTIASFISRISFFANKSFVKVEFTILNPKAAKHPGGLWDLGDTGSIYFKDLSICSALNSNSPLTTIRYQLNDEGNKLTPISSKLVSADSGLIIYQDSSGGENWKSMNHVNRNGEVKTSFRGYRVYEDEKPNREGLRANPLIALSNEDKYISGGIKCFWQNFPKALEGGDNTVIMRLFPKKFNDLFELQGGEQKTHTIYFDFGNHGTHNDDLRWIHSPLIPRTTPKWYCNSGAFPYIVPESEDTDSDYTEIINLTIDGDNTFFDRREIIDEYGWRNFGELYADHENVGNENKKPRISHYNNQYDCIYGFLMQYVKSGDHRWFALADQLATHVKDIDIYHTNEDRPEYNRGMFWHTEHYIDAGTATHRCFSKKHLEFRNKFHYGGGPSLSHNYATGILYHYYLTGDYSSAEAVSEMGSYIVNNIENDKALLNSILKSFRKAKVSLKSLMGKTALVELGKVYALDGPGRASGNSLNTLLDSFILTESEDYLVQADVIINDCISPEDNISDRELLDTEVKWFYVVFLQSLGKYLDIKTEREQFDYMWHYSKNSLLHYAQWMLENEYPFLEKPEKLEYPNETWAAQDIRKCNVFLYAAKYCKSNSRSRFIQKASFFYEKGMGNLETFETKNLTRPMAVIMLNGQMHDCFMRSDMDNWQSQSECKKMKNGIKKHCILRHGIFIPVLLIRKLMKFSLKREYQFLMWRLLSR